MIPTIFLGPMASKSKASITDVSEEEVAAELKRKNAERQRRYKECKRQAETEEEAVVCTRLMNERQQKYRECKRQAETEEGTVAHKKLMTERQ